MSSHELRGVCRRSFCRSREGRDGRGLREQRQACARFGRAAVVLWWLATVSAWGGASVSYLHPRIADLKVHAIYVNLHDKRVKVSVHTASSFPGGAESFGSMIGRTEPTAAVTGTYFSTTSYRPVGDLVADGRLLYFGGLGTALAITPDNSVVFRKVQRCRRVDWGQFETVVAAGPTLVWNGQVGVRAEEEGFTDPSLQGEHRRTAVGLTERNRLLLVVVSTPVSLNRMAHVMRRLDCIDAINLDGGSSAAMYYRGKYVVRPGRRLVNLITVHEDVPVVTRYAAKLLPKDALAITQYREVLAHEHSRRAKAHREANEPEAALRELVEACRLAPRHASYRVMLADARLAAGDEAGASASLTEAAEIYREKSRPQEALAALRQALALDDLNLKALGTLARTYSGLGQKEEARETQRRLRLAVLRTSARPRRSAEMVRLVNEQCAASPGCVLPPGWPASSGPILTGVVRDRTYRDRRLQFSWTRPPEWELLASDDPSVLELEDRVGITYAVLRVLHVPMEITYQNFVRAYSERTYAAELEAQEFLLANAQAYYCRTREQVDEFTVDATTVFVRRGTEMFVIEGLCLAEDYPRAKAKFKLLWRGLDLQWTGL